MARVPPARSKRRDAGEGAEPPARATASKPKATAIQLLAPGTVGASTELQDLPIEQIKGVGAQVAAILRKRGIETAGDLLARAPVRYLDLRHADDWALARDNIAGALVALTAVVADARRIGHPRRGGLALSLRDPAGNTTLRAVFFHAPPGLHERATPGSSVRVIGTLRTAANGIELVHPRLLAPGTRNAPIEPVYAGIGTLAAGTVARLVAAAVEDADSWGDPVPRAVASAMALVSSGDALRAIHKPSASTTREQLVGLNRGESPAHRRLAFEELLAVQAALETMRRAGGEARAIARSDDLARSTLEQRLAITLSDGQRAAVDTILGDLANTHPMRRLLVAEVGAGKTAVAAAASLAVLRAGGSVAWLAPTAIVAEQHAATLTRAFGPDGGPLAVLLGSTPKRARDAARQAMAGGMVRAVVGTHALLEPGSMPANLTLAVVDEQHRFGVAQRLAMVAGRTPTPHLLVLSATPIPRSLVLTRYGDLDVVTMAGQPGSGPRSVTTRVVDSGDRALIVTTIQRALAANEGSGRAFVVVPRIESEEGSEAAIAGADAWLATTFGRDRVAIVHGRMTADAQREAIQGFRRGTHPILLGTSVVEVGLDVRDANLMVVLGAEHFGIAQLHQLRGRVGRAGQKAACLLVPDQPSAEARTRLEEVAACDDGFALAERDLLRRGGGEWFGEQQSGSDQTLHFADPVRDTELLEAAATSAKAILAEDPTLARHRSLSRAVDRLLARGAAPVAEEAG